MAGLGPVQTIRPERHGFSGVMLWTEDSGGRKCVRNEDLACRTKAGGQSGLLGGRHDAATYTARGSSLGTALRWTCS